MNLTLQGMILVNFNISKLTVVRKERVCGPNDDKTKKAGLVDRLTT